MISEIAITSFYLPSVDKIGVGYQAHYMAEAMLRRGYRVTMFSPAPKVEGANYEHRQVDAGNRFRLHGFAWAMRKLDLSNFDVLHSHGECHWLWTMPRMRRPKVHVRTIHGSCLEEARHIRGLSNKVRMLYIAATETLSCATADRVAAVSSNTCRFYPWIKRVIPNGVDLTEFRPGEKELSPTLLFVGTYHNRKRGKWLIDVFSKEVRSRVPDARLWMVCSDVPNAAFRDGVEVLGRLTLEQLGDYYRRAWVFTLPSTYEGFGVPYIEAMASGTAVVTTPNPGSIEVLEQGRWGALVNDAAFGEAIVRVLSDEVDRNTLSAKGIVRAEQYGWDAVTEQYELMYQTSHTSLKKSKVRQ